MSMNIYAKKGDKVFTTRETIDWGYDCDAQQANKYLKVDVMYTVDHTEVSGWSTSVFLEEFPNIPFNSVHFKDEIEFGNEIDELKEEVQDLVNGITGRRFTDEEVRTAIISVKEKNAYNQAIDDAIKAVKLTDFAYEFLQEGADDAIDKESLLKLKK